MRILCPECKFSYKLTSTELKQLGDRFQNKIFYKSKGCSHCNYKGYMGRTAISEILIVNDDIRSLILQSSSSTIIKKKAIKQGMMTFREHGFEKAMEGLTSIEEVLSNTQLDI